MKGESPESLERYEDDTLSRLLTVKIPDAQVIDIASDGDASVWALISSHKPKQENPQVREKLCQSIRVDRFGHVVEIVNFRGISNARAFVFLPRSKRFVVLAADPDPRLYWIPKQDDPAGFGIGAIFSLPVGGMRPCFVAHALGSDSSDKVFLAGADGKEFGGKGHLMIFDADGDVLGELPLDAEDAPATGVAAGRDSLIVTGRRGLLQFKLAEVVPEGAEQVQCMLMTPLLFSRDREDKRRWLRVEATASLPEGSTLEISWTATDDDAATRNRLSALAMDESFTASQVVSQVLNEPNLHRGQTVFHGAAGSDPKATSDCTREKDTYEIRVLRTRPDCACGCPQLQTDQNPNAGPAGIPGEVEENACKCVKPYKPNPTCYDSHYDGDCGCTCGKCSGCDCQCIVLALLNKPSEENLPWRTDHSVRRFIRPVLMRDPQVEDEAKKRAAQPQPPPPQQQEQTQHQEQQPALSPEQQLEEVHQEVLQLQAEERRLKRELKEQQPEAVVAPSGTTGGK